MIGIAVRKKRCKAYIQEFQDETSIRSKYLLAGIWDLFYLIYVESKHK